MSLSDDVLRGLNAEEQDSLPNFARTFTHMAQTYPGLVRGVEFARVPLGMQIHVFDRSLSTEKPAYRLNILNRDWGLIMASVPGEGMFFPCYSLDDYNVLLTFGMQPPGMILASGAQP